MQLAHPARQDLDQRGGDRDGRREILGIGDADRSALGPDRVLRHQAMTERLRHRRYAGNPVGRKWPGHGQRKDVELARVGRAGKGRCRDAEVLRKNIGRHVLEPIADQERVVLGKAPVVEHQQKLAAVGLQPLDRVRNSRREIPEVADADVIGEIAAVLVDGGDARTAIQHVGPFGGLVPMELAHTAGVQAHVDAGDVFGDSELALGNLTGPAAALQSHVGLRKRKLQVRHGAVIGRRRHIDVRILQFERNVARSGIGAAASRTRRLRRTGRRIGCLRICGGDGGDS